METIAQVMRRRPNGGLTTGACVVLGVVAHGGCGVGVEGAPVELGGRRPSARLIDDDKFEALGVRRRRCLECERDAPVERAAGDDPVEIEVTPDGSRRREDGDDGVAHVGLVRCMPMTAVTPPSTGYAPPVMKDASSLDRKATTRAISSG